MGRLRERLIDLGRKTGETLLALKERASAWGSKKKLLIGSGVLVLIIFGLWLAGVFGSKTSQVQAAVATVRRGDIRVVVSGTGTVTGIMEQNIEAKVGGTVASIGFPEGSQVKQGDLLLQLENPDVLQKLAAAELSLAQDELDYRQSALDFGKLSVTAPFAGRITSMGVKEGDEVNKGDTLLTLVNDREMELVVPVNGGDVKRVYAGQSVDVFLTDFFISVPGRVDHVASGGRADSSGGVLYDVRILLANQGGLSPGLKAKATIHTSAGDVMSFGQGELKYARTIDITAAAQGTVSSINARQNDSVEKNQKILQITSDTASVDVNLKNKKLQQSSLNLEAARADVASLNIRAPFDGILVKLGKNLSDSSDRSNSSSSVLTTQGLRVGDEVKAGSIVARLVNFQQMLVTIMVDEIDIPKVAVGQKAQITADALPGRQFSGEVVFVSSEGESENGVASFEVTIRIDHPEGLMAGMTVNADILVAEKNNVLLLPIEALQERAGRKYVTMADSGDQKTAATSVSRQKEIKVGLSNETYVEVVSGLEEGDQVLLPSAASFGFSQNQRIMVPGMGGPPPSGGGFRYNR